MKCFECGLPAQHAHHVVPKSRGGTKTVPLCEECHAKAHHTEGWMGNGSLVRQVLQAKKAKSERTGTIPYGFRLASDGKSLVVDPVESANAEPIKKLYDGGMVRLHQISKELAKRGILNRVGNPFSIEAMRNILQGRREIKPRTKLTDADLLEIRARANKLESYSVLAADFNITKDHVCKIVRGRCRSNGYVPPLPLTRKVTKEMAEEIRLLKRRNVSQADIARRMNISQSVVSHIVNGKTHKYNGA